MQDMFCDTYLRNTEISLTDDAVSFNATCISHVRCGSHQQIRLDESYRADLCEGLAIAESNPPTVSILFLMDEVFCRFIHAQELSKTKAGMYCTM